MAVKPELKKAIAYEKIRASQWNDTFQAMLDYIEANNDELKLKVNTINSQLSTQVLSNLQQIYPVGSIYIGEMETCPLQGLFGIWEKVGEGIVTNIQDEVSVYGNGKALGLTIGDKNFGLITGTNSINYDFSHFLHTSQNAINQNVGNTANASNYNVNKVVGISQNPDNSGLVGDIDAITLSVNIWKRIE